MDKNSLADSDWGAEGTNWRSNSLWVRQCLWSAAGEKETTDCANCRKR